MDGKLVPGTETYALESLSTSKLAPNWLYKSVQPIRGQISKLTQLLTLTRTQKFPPQEKEHMLEEFYKTGSFPHTMFDKMAAPPTLIKHDPLRYGLLHAFYIISTLIAVYPLYQMVAWFKH